MASPSDDRLDLAAARILEPGPGRLAVVSVRTPELTALAAVLALAAFLCAAVAWRSRTEGWLSGLWPWGLIAPVLAAAAAGLLFGHQQKVFDGAARMARAEAALGPWRRAEVFPLPAQGTVRITFRKELPSSAGGHSPAPVRWYDVDLDGFPALGLTVAGDREAARALGRRLAAVLGYVLVDEVEDDGVTRSRR